jgi:hypothetical protein
MTLALYIFVALIITIFTALIVMYKANSKAVFKTSIITLVVAFTGLVIIGAGIWWGWW